MSASIQNDQVLQEASDKQLEQAAADNHIELFRLNALSEGGEVQNREGLIYTFDGKGGNIGFPMLNDDNAGASLDEVMNYYRQHSAKGVGCWSLEPPQPSDLGLRLLARGFQLGWQPCWMAMDLDHINTHPIPAGLEILADNQQPTGHIKDLPYAGATGAVSVALIEQQPQKVRRFIATLNGKIVGHSAVLLSDGPYGVGGLYNVGVVPSARNQGIAKAVVSAACRYAKEQGYRYATLNGTGRRMYEQVGFRFISHGRTWWLMTDRYISNPPSANEVAFIEAIGRGDMKEVDRLAVHRKDLTTAITNGMSLMQIAVHYKQYESVQWLSDHGLPVTALDAWDIGWKERAEKILADNPQEVNRLYEEGELTLLHQAAMRNDIELVKLALKAKPDMNIKDKHYQSTAYGWAFHFGRQEMKQLMKEYMETNK